MEILQDRDVEGKKQELINHDDLSNAGKMITAIKKIRNKFLFCFNFSSLWSPLPLSLGRNELYNTFYLLKLWFDCSFLTNWCSLLNFLAEKWQKLRNTKTLVWMLLNLS